MIYCSLRITSFLHRYFIWYLSPCKKIRSKTSSSLVMDSCSSDIPSCSCLWPISMVDCWYPLRAICSCYWWTRCSRLYTVCLLPSLKTYWRRYRHDATPLFLLNYHAPLPRSQSSQTIYDTCMGTWPRSNHSTFHRWWSDCCKCCLSYGRTRKAIRNHG